MRLLTILTAGLALLTGPLAASGLEVQAFNINSGLLLQLYNNANQTSQQISSYPSNMDPTVVQATVRNTTDVEAKPCFRLVISDPSSSCGSNGIVKSPVIIVKEAIPANTTKVLTAADFTTNGSYDGQLCSAFEDELKKNFDNIDASNIGKVVDYFLKHRYKVCLVEWDCTTDTQGSSQACSDFTLFTPNPAAQASSSVLIYPHNNELPNCEFNFMWTPAMFPGLAPSDISYQLEISELADGEVLVRIDIPAGQTFYNWGPNDRKLENGKQYYWKVLSRNAKTGATFGGPDGRGYSAYKWFRCGAAAAQACHYSLADLHQLVMNRATPEVKAALAGMKIKALLSPAAFDDQDICKLINRQAELNGINVTKK
jgi:hypothetical protein